MGGYCRSIRESRRGSANELELLAEILHPRSVWLFHATSAQEIREDSEGGAETMVFEGQILGSPVQARYPYL